MSCPQSPQLSRRKPWGQDAALEEGVELVLDELRQIGPGGRLCLGDEDHGVLLHHAVQYGLLGAVALVVNRCAIRRPIGLPADGLRAMLPRLGPRTVSRSAPRLNHSVGRLPVGAYLRVANSW